MKNIRVFLSENFQFFGGEIFYIFKLVCFRNDGVGKAICGKYIYMSDKRDLVVNLIICNVIMF